jgi:hypothetical protein
MLRSEYNDVENRFLQAASHVIQVLLIVIIVMRLHHVKAKA